MVHIYDIISKREYFTIIFKVKSKEGLKFINEIIRSKISSDFSVESSFGMNSQEKTFEIDKLSSFTFERNHETRTSKYNYGTIKE